MLAKMQQADQPSQKHQLIDLCAQIQKDELNALQSIYLSEFEFNQSHQPYQFNILIKPYVPNDHFERENLLIGSLQIELPFDYPIGKQEFCFEFEALVKQSRLIVESVFNETARTAQQNEFGDGRGPIIFSIVETLREWLHTLSENNEERMKSQAKAPTDNFLFIPPMPKFDSYTIVTHESFALWKKKFDAEMYEQKKKQKSYLIEEEMLQKLTGKQHFQKKLEKEEFEEELNDDDAEELAEDDFREEESENEDEPKRLYQIQENFQD